MGKPKISTSRGKKGTVHFSCESTIAASPEEVFAWHEHPSALHRLMPPWLDFKVKQHEGISEGARSKFEVPVGLIRKKWVAEYRDYESSRQFRDVQIKGPFRSWSHLHRMEPDDDGCKLRDDIEYQLPWGFLGRFLAGPSVRRNLTRQFAYRHRVIANDVLAHNRYGGRSMRVAVRGSRGLIGENLVHYLRAGGHDVYRLIDKKKKARESDRGIYYNHQLEEVDVERLEGLDAVVNLSTENVFTVRWSDTTKMEILASRVRGTEFLAETLASLDNPPGVFLSESATGYYGDRGDKILTEESSLGEGGFLMALCKEWEDAVRPAQEAGIRTVPMRMGVVFTPEGGAMEYLLLPFRWGLGGRIGGRNQYFPWIALDDVLKGIYHLLTSDDIEGPVNLSAPHPVTAEDMVSILSKVLSRPAILKIPEPVTRFLFGKSVEDLLLNSARVKPKRLLDSEYDFLYPRFESALRHLLGSTSS